MGNLIVRIKSKLYSHDTFYDDHFGNDSLNITFDNNNYNNSDNNYANHDNKHIPMGLYMLHGYYKEGLIITEKK